MKQRTNSLRKRENTISAPKLVLGSASPFRKKLLEEAGFVFDIKTADIDEKEIRYNTEGFPRALGTGAL